MTGAPSAIAPTSTTARRLTGIDDLPPAGERQLHDRIATLEAREVEQARVVEQMAEQLEGLTVSVEVLAARNRLLVGVVVALAVAMFLITVSVAR
jgi:uncharacterized coiled-coil protein SlyX